MINAVIYSRVSSESERQDTQRQTTELKQYASRMGYNIVEVYEEKVSGFKKNEQRPVFTKMLEDINTNQIDKILVWELSRIGRSVLNSLQNIQILHDLKVGIYIKNFNLETLNDDKTPNSLSMFMVQILFAVANMESKMTLARLQSGYRNHIKKHGSKSVGRKKGSVDSDEKILERHSDVARLLKRGLSIRNISAITNKSSNTVLKVKKLM
ncbi:MAG: recombinase family protein [Flavobacteriaceae bacterium]|jgi:DNA invertase Pin-like site-specific DNA recombinase|nr:recombinase family protein [Flavobacteriaceae bacterium]MBT3920793.1 recombinase family protein [Flavobacteriaceae bacterium]